MRKEELLQHNRDFVSTWQNIMLYYAEQAHEHELNGYRLLTCKAYVIETPKYYILKSYNTIVAAIDRENDTLYDALRFVYGYTATSAQHITKFGRVYGSGKWGCTKMRRFYTA